MRPLGVFKTGDLVYTVANVLLYDDLGIVTKGWSTGKYIDANKFCIVLAIRRPKKTTGDWMYVFSAGGYGWVADWAINYVGPNTGGPSMAFSTP